MLYAALKPLKFLLKNYESHPDNLLFFTNNNGDDRRFCSKTVEKIC